MAPDTASSSTPLGSTARSVLMVSTYCSMMSSVAAPAPPHLTSFHSHVTRQCWCHCRWHAGRS